MFTIDLKDEFKKLAFQLESMGNQLQHTFVLKEKDALRLSISNMKKKLNALLDEYNRGEK